LESKNGTHLRGERLVSPVQLMDGDEIRLGDVLVKFRQPGFGTTTDTQLSS
jgi:pSer/pThr/pTyr-binding forkhead associated (FHA) protein